MATPKVYIDGSSGTTGLRIRDQLSSRDDVDLSVLNADDRRNVDMRRREITEADLVILCLPDDAALEAAMWGQEAGTKIIDASTAHRVDESWVFGLPEMDSGQRGKIIASSAVSNPGCYPTGAILSLRPLTDNGLLHRDSPITVHAVSGYSGGGKKMIARWEGDEPDLHNLPFESPYALHTKHKHIPEMTKYSGLVFEPLFVPSVGSFITGMRLEIPLHRAVLPENVSAIDIWEVLHDRYVDETFVKIHSIEDSLAYSEPAFDPQIANNTNRVDITVIPSELGHALLIIQLDNLGKGASGSAIQNMNLMLGFPEGTGLKA